MNNLYKMMNFLVLTVLFSCAIARDILCPDGKLSCPKGKTCCFVDGKFSCCDTNDNDAESKWLLPEEEYENNLNSFINKVFPGIIPVCSNATCEDGTYCINGRCGSTSSDNCPPGSACREKRSANCAAAQHLCPKGDHCCDAAWSCCGNTCCAAARPCCQGYRCCEAADKCCGNGCCKAAQTCCPGTNICCDAAYTCCGSGCCPPG